MTTGASQWFKRAKPPSFGRKADPRQAQSVGLTPEVRGLALSEPRSHDRGHQFKVAEVDVVASPRP